MRDKFRAWGENIATFWIEVVQSVSTWKLPYHLLTFLMSITLFSW